MSKVPRRVVTGHSPDGVSVVVSDGPVPVSRRLLQDGVEFHEIWNTSGSPAPITAREAVEPTERDLTVPPPPLGTKIRINEFAPGYLHDAGLQSPVHRTRSIDYGIVLEDEITLVLDDSEVTLRAGDVVVQRGTDHACTPALATDADPLGENTDLAWLLTSFGGHFSCQVGFRSARLDAGVRTRRPAPPGRGTPCRSRA